MLLTSILIIYFAIKKWHWNWVAITCMSLFFGTIDLSFFGANIQKLSTGGWVPILFASLAGFIMYTWHNGRIYLHKTYYLREEQLAKLIKQLDYKKMNQLPDTTAVFITDIYDKSGGSFLHFLKLNRTLPGRILILNYSVENVPHVLPANRFKVACLNEYICELTLHYGFMDTVSVPKALRLASQRQVLPFPIDLKKVTYMLEIPNVVASPEIKALWFLWQEKLFAFLVRNYSANLNIEFYQLPFDRTVAIGTYYQI